MSVNARFQLRWIMNTALICAFACSVLLLILQQVLGRALSHDYGTAYLALKDLENSLVFAVSMPVLAYVLLASVLVIFFKMLISHKIAGPLYRLEMCVASLARGNLDFCTRLRRGDQLNRLAHTVGELKEDLKRPVEDARLRLGRLEELLDKGDMEGFDRELDALGKALRPGIDGSPAA